MFVLLIFQFFQLPSAFSQSTFCSEAYECVNTTIDVTGFVFPRGYKSAAGINTNIISTSDLRVQGGFGAYKVGSVNVEDISVFSDSGLSYANPPLISTASINCFTTNSCTHTTLQSDATTVNAIYRCWGEQSCAGSILTETQTVEGYGAYSLLNAIIFSTGDATTTVNLYGYKAGYNLTIKGLSGETVNINCYGNGCNGTLLDCDGTCNVNCNQTHADSHSCPIESSVGSLDQIDFLVGIDTQVREFFSNCTVLRYYKRLCFVCSTRDLFLNYTRTTSRTNNLFFCIPFFVQFIFGRKSVFLL